MPHDTNHLQMCSKQPAHLSLTMQGPNIPANFTRNSCHLQDTPQDGNAALGLSMGGSEQCISFLFLQNFTSRTQTMPRNTFLV